MSPANIPRNQPPSANEAVARLRLWFRGRSLHELEIANVLEWDKENNVVRKGEKFDTKWKNVRR